jgi:hypothetical protein
MGKTFRISVQFVASEVIDGEAVMVDLRSGNYFSATGSGGWIWRNLETGRSYLQILQLLTVRYAIAPTILKDALDRFLAKLVDHNLVESITADDPATDFGQDDIELPLAATDYEPPVLTMHTDMQDLLLLDPIHDVDSAGWPTRKG